MNFGGFLEYIFKKKPLTRSNEEAFFEYRMLRDELIVLLVKLAEKYNHYIRYCNRDDFELVCGMFGLSNHAYKERFDYMRTYKPNLTKDRNIMVPATINVGINNSEMPFNYIRPEYIHIENLYHPNYQIEGAIRFLKKEIEKTRKLIEFFGKNLEDRELFSNMTTLDGHIFNEELFRSTFKHHVDGIEEIIQENYINFFKKFDRRSR